VIAYLWKLLLITKHETKMVVRSWPFRIVTFLCFGVASLQIIGMLAAIHFVSADLYLGPIFTASNIAMLGLAQVGGLLTWIVIFFGNDIGSRDKRVGISDVVSSRPMSVGQYVVARLIALMLPLVFLMASVLVVSVVANVAFGLRAAAFRQYAPFFLYFCVLSVGFASALTAFCSTIFRNRLLASAAALIPILASAVWLMEYSALFDIGGFRVSGTYSDLIGYGPTTELIAHRLLYVCLTLFLVSAAILFYPRPEGARRPVTVMLAFAVLLAASTALTYRYVTNEQDSAARWHEGRDALEAATTNRGAAVDHYDMDLAIKADRGRIEAHVTTLLRNRESSAQRTFVFVLNPGLAIEGVSTAQGRPVSVARRESVATLTLDAPLAPGESIEIAWQYGGTIDPRAAWVNEAPLAETWGKHSDAQAANVVGKLSAWVGNRFSFFLPESHWYPIPNATFGHAYPAKRPANFATARIRVQMPAGWIGVTQGTLIDERIDDSGSVSVFEAKVPVPQFSLCAGEYRRVNAEINGIACSLYYAPEHKGNIEFFADAGDEVKRLIGDSLESITSVLGIDYPYGSLAVVETPSQCRTYGDSWDGRNLTVQPGVLLLSEADFFNAYFTQSYDRAEVRSKEQGTGATNAQIKAELLRRYFNQSAFGGDLELNLMANYWEFQVDAVGTARGALGSAFTAALADRAIGRHQRGDDFAEERMGEMGAGFDENSKSPVDAAIEMDREKEVESDQEELLMPLAALNPAGQEERFTWLLNRKTSGLLGTLSTVMGDKAWQALVPELLAEYRFKEFTIDDLERAVSERCEEDVAWIFHQFVSEPVMPGYMITHAEAYEIDAGQRDRQFQVVARIANIEEGKGYVRLSIPTEGGPESDRVEQRVFFDSFEEKEVRMVLRNKPFSLVLKSACSRNVQDPLETLFVPEERRNVPGEESIRIIPEGEGPPTVTVDDMDPGFTTVNLQEETRVRLVKPRKPGDPIFYPEHNGFGAPRQWERETTSAAFGQYLRTRKVKARGDGSQMAVWSATLPKDGAYEVFFYSRFAWGGRYRIDVESAEGSQEVEFDLSTAKNGWNSLGKYTFSKDSVAYVKLSDDILDGYRWSRVNADAVRWVYQDTPDGVQEN
jgi:hypothetical protein